MKKLTVVNWLNRSVWGLFFLACVFDLLVLGMHVDFKAFLGCILGFFLVDYTVMWHNFFDKKRQVSKLEF